MGKLSCIIQNSQREQGGFKMSFFFNMGNAEAAFLLFSPFSFESI